MLSPRRLLAMFCGLLVAGWVLNGSARSTDPTQPDQPPGTSPLELQQGSESKRTATMAPGIIRLKATYGFIELDPLKLKQLSIAKTETGKVLATATLGDKSHLTGELLAAPTVTADSKPVDLTQADDLVVTFTHPKDTSLVAAILGLITLCLMEIVLGVDNVIFLAIVAGKLPTAQQPLARRIGLFAALGTRLALLGSLTFLLQLTRPLFTLPEMPFFESIEARGISWRDIILLVGGAFLIAKSTFEMHEKLEHAKEQQSGTGVAKKAASFAQVIVQIAIIDIIFSLDSVITAVGMVDEVWVMITAMLVAVGVMLVAAEPIARFVDRRPTVKILALSFLILIGVMLVVEGLGQHIDKGYIYFAMAFSVGVELVNIRLRGSPSPMPGEMPDPTPTVPG